MNLFSPTSLTTVTSVDVVALRGIVANRVNEYMRAAGEAPRVTLRGENAEKIASLWRQLPPGEQSRCHIPPFGLRFRVGDRIVCEASICWQCDNIFGESEGVDFHYGFDAKHQSAIDLLAQLKAAIEEVK